MIGCPKYTGNDSSYSFAAKEWLEKKALAIQKEEQARIDKVGLILTNEEKEEIEEDKQEFLATLKSGQKPDLEGNSLDGKEKKKIAVKFESCVERLFHWIFLNRKC